MSRLPATLLILHAPSLASALEIVPGRYSPDAAEYVTPGYEGAVTLELDTIRFNKSCCKLENEVPIRDMGSAALFDATCGGEGETWTRRMLLLPLCDGGLAIGQSGAVATYARCGD